jgi:hypothetical protein
LAHAVQPTTAVSQASKGVMAKEQKTAKQSQDPYAQRGKALSSEVQRLRGWVGSDPSRAPELADALVQLTAHRLLGHGYAAAAADAQEAVRRTAELLAEQGPIGPYTSIRDAARYATAVIHLATIQAGVGLPDAAAGTLESLQGIQDQLGDELSKQLAPQTALWAVWCNSRSALASGDVGAANAYADAGVTRIADLGNDPDAAYLVIDVNRLASDCRWAARLAEEALSYLYAAKDRYDNVIAGRLDEPGRLSPALLERLAEPLFSLYRDMADRLIALREVDLGLVTRRRLIELLHGVSGRLGDPTHAQLAVALTDLSRDLARLDRFDEADAASAEAAAIMPEESDAVQNLRRGVVNLGTELSSWNPLPETKIADLAALQRAGQQRTAAWLQVERAAAQRSEHERMEQARAEAERRDAEQAVAERAAAEQRAAERAETERTERLEAERRARAEEAERLERKRRREERLEEHRLEVEKREAEQREAQRQEAERQELEHLQAQIDELERAEKRRREQ